MTIHNTNLSEQSPQTGGSDNGLMLGAEPKVTQIVTHVTNIVTILLPSQARMGFVKAYSLIMLERLWSRRSKNETRFTLSAGNDFERFCHPATEIAGAKQ
jgi:hypothetical protein